MAFIGKLSQTSIKRLTLLCEIYNKSQNKKKNNNIYKVKFNPIVILEKYVYLNIFLKKLIYSP